jgi:Type II secretory pathway, component ExeA (predicted ATPase)
MNYLLKYGIERNPFVKNDNDEKIELNNTKQLTFRLKHLEETKGIGLVTGEPGLGKSTTMRHWVKSLNKNIYKTIYISHSTVSVHEFYRELCDQFGLDEYYSKRKNLNAIQAEIKRLNIEKRITPVIILDEANYLLSSILNDLKILLNFEMDSKEPYILILVGQNTLRDSLNRKSNEALKQRISMSYNFEPMDYDESKEYIDTNLSLAGANSKLLSNEAYNLVIGKANGVPRILNQIMDKALLLMENKK